MTQINPSPSVSQVQDLEGQIANAVARGEEREATLLNLKQALLSLPKEQLLAGLTRKYQNVPSDANKDGSMFKAEVALYRSYAQAAGATDEEINAAIKKATKKTDKKEPAKKTSSTRRATDMFLNETYMTFARACSGGGSKSAKV